MTTDIILRRLNLVKNLYRQGLNQSKEPESIAYTAILSLHDAMDMFMNLAAEANGINKGQYLMQYFDAMPQLTLKASVAKINTRRKAIKHDGLIPAKVEIEDSCSVATSFFEANTQIIFNLDFWSVSWFQLISYDEPRKFLEEASVLLRSQQYEPAAMAIAKAFFHLLLIHDEINKYGRRSPWPKSDPVPVLSEGRFFVKGVEPWFEGMEAKLLEPKRPDGYVEVTEGVAALSYIYNQAFVHLHEIVGMLSLGLDTKKHNFFKSFMPAVYSLDKENGKYRMTVPVGYKAENFSAEKLNFAIEFVAAFALNLQENYTTL